MKIDLFVFDWSGVISDDRAPVYEANMQILIDYGKPTMTFEEWLPRTTLTPIEFVNNHGVFDDPEKLWNLYKKYLNEAIESGIVPKVYPDARDVFEHLRGNGKVLAVLSSHPDGNLRREAEAYGLDGFLDMVRGNSKDKVGGLLAICDELNKEPEHSLYTGDTIFDIQAANGAGLHSAGVCQGYHVRERLESENPEFIFETLSDIKKLDIE